MIIVYIGSIDYSVKQYPIDTNQERGIIDVEIPPDADPGLVHNNISGSLQFDFDKIFDTNVTQDNVFDIVARSKISNVLEGIHSFIYSYIICILIRSSS